MFIKEVTIHDFKGIKNVKFTPDQSMNYLVAENNIGKTRLLEAIKAFYDKEKDSTISIIFSLSEADATICTQIGILEQTSEITIDLREGKHLFGDIDLKNKIKTERLFGWYIYVPSLTDHEKSQDPSKPNLLREILRTILSVEDLKSPLADFNKSFANFYENFSSHAEGHVSMINKEITLPEFEVKFERKEFISDDLVKNSFELKISEGGKLVNFSEVSTGVQRNIINAILCSQKQDHFYVFLYDEPEAYLNPTAQRELINSISSKNPSSQFFIATHSPYCITRQRDVFRTILRLEKSGEGSNIRVHGFDEERFGNLVNSFNKNFDANYQYILTSDANRSILKFWEPNRINALFEKKILLLEGPTEELFFDFNIHRELNIPVINTLGKFNMPYYIILFKEIFGITVNVLCDEDSHSKMQHEKYHSWFKEKSVPCLILSNDFESKLGYRPPNKGHEKPKAYLEKHFDGSITKMEADLKEEILNFWRDCE